MTPTFPPSPRHGDITTIGFTPAGRFYVELFDSDLAVCRRFYEDRRETRRRERQRDKAVNN
jgi:hypothetical protein